MSDVLREKLRQLTIEVPELEGEPFSYYPPNWGYREGDHMQFVCNEGPFAVTYIPIEKETGNVIPATVSPFGRLGGDTGPLILDVEGSTVVHEGTPAERWVTEPREVRHRGLAEDNKLNEHGGEYIEYFRYHVKIRGGADVVPPQPDEAVHNGGWCG